MRPRRTSPPTRAPAGGWRLDSRARSSLERFSELLDRGERLRTRGLPFDELRELARLYREHSSRLARLRDRGADPDAVHHLNSLCVRAYGILYSKAGPGATGTAERPLAEELPVAWAATAGARTLAWALLALGGAMGLGLASADPDALYALMPSGFGYSPEVVDRLWSSPEARAAFLAREEGAIGSNAIFGSVLFTHNTKVGMLAFATGVLAGIPTLLLQTYNGLMLGGFFAIFLRDPWPAEFVAWILPHGVPELTAITWCAAGGLVLGGAIAQPGRRSRPAALRAAAVPAGLHFAMAIPLFALAAVMESFVRESAIGTAPRLASAAGIAMALLLLHAVLRRAAGPRRAEAGWLRSLAGGPHAGAP